MPAPTANTDDLLLAIAERFATSQGGTANAEAVANIANSIRWEPRLDRNPPAVVIMRRGKKVAGVSNVLAVISKEGEYADLYPSWVSVLAHRKAVEVANNKSRVSHEGLPTGKVPQ